MYDYILEETFGTSFFIMWNVCFSISYTTESEILWNCPRVALCQVHISCHNIILSLEQEWNVWVKGLAGIHTSFFCT